MSGYPYSNQQQPPQQGFIYPQLYNPANAPPPSQMGQVPPNYPMGGQNPQYPYPQHPYPQAGYPYAQAPAAMSYAAPPSAPPAGGPPMNYGPTPVAPNMNYAQPNVTPTANYGQIVEWIRTSPQNAQSLSDRAVVAGYEGHDGSPLWVIRAQFEGDMIPGKLAVKYMSVPWGGRENAVQNIEVCCARPERIRWVESRNGIIPPNAIIAGNTRSGEPLYIGRAKEQGSLTPGKVHASHQSLYISFAGREIPHKVYETLCTV